MSSVSVTPLPPAKGATLAIGQRVDKYVVRGPLAAGTWARVFEAQHERLGSEVAIKVLTANDEDVRGRFEREAKTAARLRHRNIMEVYDVGSLDDGTPYLVMELLRGQDLAAQLEDGPLSIAAVVDLGRQLAAALVALADAGIVHRDIKPQNIMLHHEGDEVVAKLVDFGVSKPTRTAPASSSLAGMIVGTPYYMAPEQIRGERVGTGADLYAIGVVLYESLTGRKPFEGGSVQELAARVLDEPPPRVRKLRPDCPDALEDIVLHLLAKRPEERHRDPRALATELELLAEKLRLSTGASAWAALEAERASLPAVRPSLSPDRGIRTWVVLAVLALLALVAATAGGWIGP